jgi:hypothetical protein
VTSGIIGVTSGWNSVWISRDRGSGTAVKFACALGAGVMVFTNSPEKTDDAKRFGVKDVINQPRRRELGAAATHVRCCARYCPFQHDRSLHPAPLARRRPGAGFDVGRIEDSDEIGQMNLVLSRSALAGSKRGGIAETQGMVDVCGRNKVAPEIGEIPMSGIDDTQERVIAKQARYRFAIDGAQDHEASIGHRDVDGSGLGLRPDAPQFRTGCKRIPARPSECEARSDAGLAPIQQAAS